MRSKFLRLLLCCSALIGTSDAANAQDNLDIQAWNFLWQKMEDMIKNSDAVPLDSSEILNLLVIPRPLAAPDEPDDLYKIQLMNIAGVIPKPDFALDISANDRKLSDAYSDIIYRITVDEGTPQQKAAFAKAAQDYQDATKLFNADSLVWRKKILDDLQYYKDTGGTPTREKYYELRDANSGLVSGSLSKLSAAAKAWQNAALGDQMIINTIISLKQAVDGSQDTSTYGIFRYRISDPIDRDKCTSEDQWSEIRLDNKIKAQSVRNSGWNAGGSWGGSFLKIGASGGTSNFSNTVTNDSDYVSLKFCKLSYVNVEAPWLSMEALRALQAGDLKLKPGTPERYLKPLGPQGIIPRRVKGLVIARSINWVVKLDRAKLTEIKKSSGGSGGFSIGPWRLGGGGSSSSYDISDVNDQGYVRIVADGKYPLILGILLEDTKP